MCQLLLKQAHGPAHESKKTTLKNVDIPWWHPTDMVDNYVAECNVCNGHNPKPVYKCPMGKFPVPDAPFKDITIDYTDMGADNRVQGFRYLLMMIDRYTKWVEAIPCRKEDAKTVGVTWSSTLHQVRQWISYQQQMLGRSRDSVRDHTQVRKCLSSCITGDS